MSRLLSNLLVLSLIGAALCMPAGETVPSKNSNTFSTFLKYGSDMALKGIQTISEQSRDNPELLSTFRSGVDMALKNVPLFAQLPLDSEDIITSMLRVGNEMAAKSSRSQAGGDQSPVSNGNLETGEAEPGSTGTGLGLCRDKVIPPYLCPMANSVCAMFEDFVYQYIPMKFCQLVFN